MRSANGIRRPYQFLVLVVDGHHDGGASRRVGEADQLYSNGRVIVAGGRATEDVEAVYEGVGDQAVVRCPDKPACEKG